MTLVDLIDLVSLIALLLIITSLDITLVALIALVDLLHAYSHLQGYMHSPYLIIALDSPIPHLINNNLILFIHKVIRVIHIVYYQVK